MEVLSLVFSSIGYIYIVYFCCYKCVTSVIVVFFLAILVLRLKGFLIAVPTLLTTFLPHRTPVRSWRSSQHGLCQCTESGVGAHLPVDGTSMGQWWLRIWCQGATREYCCLVGGCGCVWSQQTYSKARDLRGRQFLNGHTLQMLGVFHTLVLPMSTGTIYMIMTQSWFPTFFWAVYIDQTVDFNLKYGLVGEFF